MQIKKISEKLSFDVEAQDKCPHGKSRRNAACSTDCKKETWSGANAIYYNKGGDWRYFCKKTTTYSCSTSHLL